MSRNPFPSKDRKALLMTLLKMMGGARVVVDFSGGGDSGEISGASLLDADNKDISLKGAMFEWETEVAHHDPVTGEWGRQTETREMPVGDILCKITEDALDGTSLDWYNNDGGQGSLEIDLTQDPPKIDLNVEINYTHHENHYFDLNEDDEDEEGEPTQYADLDAEEKVVKELLDLVKGGGDDAPTSPRND